MPRLLKLTLSNFRNYERLVWSPDASLLVLTGENGSGKTNLLEAVSLLSPGRGLRAAPLTQFGRMGATNWGVSARIKTEDEFLELGTGTQGGQERPRRVFLLNGRQIRGRRRGKIRLPLCGLPRRWTGCLARAHPAGGAFWTVLLWQLRPTMRGNWLRMIAP